MFVRNKLLAGVGIIAMLFSMSVTANTEGARSGSSSKPVLPTATLRDKNWIHGSTNCDTNEDPAIEVFQYDQSSYILRQNKCLSFEAPFIYVLLGEEKILVLDTGATKSALDFPLYETVRSLIKTEGTIEQELLVVHSHSHSDHHAGDSQFEGKPNVTVVEPNKAALTQFFAFSEWPNGEAKLELGGRRLTVIPTPGHQEEAISIYDPHTEWLLTGDTLYPGYIYVKNWDEYKKSIARLVSFSKEHSISAVLGAHIEMTDKAGEHYPIGTIFQPNEAALTLTPADLVALNSALEKSDNADEIVLDELIIVPMNAFQKAISNVARWIIQ